MKIWALCFLVLLLPLSAGKKKEVTQVLELPKDPPAAVVAETRNLVFHVSPLTAKGLLSAQTKEAVRALLKLNSGATIVKIRAFVAGTGDMRRVPMIVSEVMTEKKMALPAVTVVQVGGLPLEGAQVVLESISVAKREVNPNGIAFIGGQASISDNPLAPTMPLAQDSLANLDKAMSGIAGVVLRVTCYTSSRDEAPKLQSMVLAKYPSAAIDVVQMQRATTKSIVECEATTRLAQARTSALEILNNGQAAAVSAQKIAFTGGQMAFGFDDKDARLAFQRLDKSLEPLGTSSKNAAMVHFYPLSNSIAEQVKRIRTECFDTQHMPATTLLPFEGLPAMEASFAVDIAAVVINQ
jgi:enamine deaminase RidA (YjgF/YER057c/UK114 family)